MNPRQMHYETLAGTIIKNLARRRMEGYYCAPSGTLKRWHSLSLPRAAQYLSAAP